MGQLFNRISQVVRAELNSNQGDYEENYPIAGTALVVGGAVTGASISKVGLLASGTGYSLGAVPLAAAGALTGAALYEVLRSLIEDDASCASAALIGAAAGAATSAAIGGVGVAVSGGAIGVGIASMAAGGAVVGLGFVGLNRLLQQGIDPEKLLASAIEQMEADSQNARQAIVTVMASQKRLQQHYEQAQAEVSKWERRVQLALQKGDEYLAREALRRKKMHARVLSSLKVQLHQEPASVKSLKRNLTLLEAKISEAKTMRTRLKEQIAAVQVNGQLQLPVSSLGTSSAMSAFERMEEKVRQMEARAQAAEQTGADLEQQFIQLEPGSDVDEELEALKGQLLGGNPLSQQLPSAPATSSTTTSSELKDSVTAKLEALKRQVDQL